MYKTKTIEKKLFSERTCACCGKKFVIPSTIQLYMYKLMTDYSHISYYCSYSHYKQAKETLENKRKNNVKGYNRRKL